jgi:ubiquinone/menaquinone biosynthesis C-methylase UbiE
LRFSDLKFDLTSWIRLRTFGVGIKFLLALLKPTKEDVILDVGAGTGVIANQVSKLCDEVFALEPRLDRVSYMKRKFPEVKAFDGVAENVQFPESYFTKVYSMSAFHHFADQDQAVSEFERILKPKGLLLIYELYPKSMVAKMEERYYGSRFQTPEGLQEKCEQAGFQKTQFERNRQGYFLLFQKA